MRIIDKTSLQDETGNINLIARVQGTLKYGFNWYPELEAQKIVIGQLDRLLEKGFVLIRNFTLPDSQIVIPIILIGQGSVSVILATPIKGHFEAAGSEWNQLINNGSPVPAKRNLVDLIAKLARVFEKYLERHNIRLDVPIEPILIASDPGAQIDSLRPAARVLRSDAIKQFASSLLQERPVMRPDSIYALAEEIINPKPKVDENASTADMTPGSRAQAIFNASQQDGAVPANLRESNPARPLARPNARKPRGMNRTQTILLVTLFIIECCVIAAGAGTSTIFRKFSLL
ncbi:MAG: hypothetical protein HC797_06730 [Anaerolineales bacterium]|nr:hypothetical protein [Anaerolineales bacterium]